MNSDDISVCDTFLADYLELTAINHFCGISDVTNYSNVDSMTQLHFFVHTSWGMAGESSNSFTFFYNERIFQ